MLNELLQLEPIIEDATMLSTIQAKRPFMALSLAQAMITLL